MKVRDLIEQLQQIDPDLQVAVSYPDGDGFFLAEKIEQINLTPVRMIRSGREELAESEHVADMCLFAEPSGPAFAAITLK